MVRITRNQPALILAPMEGFLDYPLRALLTEVGSFSHAVADFLRVSQEVPPPKTFREHIPEIHADWKTPAGTPIQAQLLGGNPERLAAAAQVAAGLGATAIDLNFGCPAPTVNRHDGGAVLLKTPERIESIVRAVRQALPPSVAVSAKLRLGWDDPDAIYANAERVEEAGAQWITIHGRTRLQGYTPPAYWKPIGEVRRRLSIPVVANGEIWNLTDFRRCRDETQCEHFMLGRGALAQPHLSNQIANELGLRNSIESREWTELFTRFARLAQAFTHRSGYAPCRMKQWARLIHSRSPLPWYETIKTLKNTQEILHALNASGAISE